MPRAAPNFVPFTVAAIAVLQGCDIYDEPAHAVMDRAAAEGWSGFSGSQRPQAAMRAAGIEYVEGYDAAMARSATERKPALVLFRANWCRWCGEMTSGVLSDQRVVQLSRRFICVAVDADRDREICHRHDVRGFPTILLLGHDGLEIARRAGRVGPADLASLLETVDVASTSLAAPAARTLR